jgi:hypothetical protein
MGDPIEGYERDETTATRMKKKRKAEVLGLLGLFFLLFAGIETGGFLLEKRSQSNEADFFSATNARCFVTGVGAVGKVESGNLFHRSVTLIFKSGNRVAYPLDGLRETSCSQLTD